MNTFGWDTVYVLSSDRVNEALLARKDQLILAFDTHSSDGFPLSAKGKFSKWEIVEGGSGQILYLKLTIGEGSCEVNFTSPKQIDISGVTMVVAVQLHLLPQQNNANTEELRFDIQKVGEVGVPPAPGTITPVALHDPNGRLDDAEEALLMVALATYIANNAGQISFVFATINLVPPSTNSWLTPVRSAYVYANRQGGSGALGILSVTTDREIGSLPRQVDSNLLSTAYDASFAISKDLFLANVVMPTLPQVFRHGTTSNTFVYNAQQKAILNTATIPTDSVKEGAITYYPQITGLRISSNAVGLVSHYEGNCDLKAGIYMYYWIDTANPAVYDRNNKTIAFLPDNNPSSRHESDIPWYFWFLGLLVKPIVDFIVSLIARGIAGSLSKDVGEKISITKNPPTSIQWSETQALNVQNAVVNEGFYMQGAL